MSQGARAAAGSGMRMEQGVFTPLSLKALLQEMASLEHMLAAVPHD